MQALHSLGQAWEVAWPVSVAAGISTIVLGKRVLAYLHRRQILDQPNERSSHTLPTPRGGGLATTPVMAVLLAALGWRFDGWEGAVLGGGALVLMALSWWDDRHSLPVLPRFTAHALVIALFLALLPSSALVFQGALPLVTDRTLALVGWLWFVNLYNFMDGIDGITGIETAGLGVGLALLAVVVGSTALLPYGGVVAATGIAFLWFNWHPARMFLGDSGSVPFGYVLGGLLVMLAVQGQLAAALILPAYYLADATITIGRRALAGEKIWQPHRKHFYQRAVQGGKRHDQVATAIAIANALLVGCALWAALGQVWSGSAAAVLVVAGLLALLQKWAQGGKA